MDKVEQLQEQVERLAKQVEMLTRSDRYTFARDIEMQNGRNFRIGGDTGTIIGQASSKLGVYGNSPVAQKTAPTQANNQGGTYSQTDAQSIADLANNIRTDLLSFGWYK